MKTIYYKTLIKKPKTLNRSLKKSSKETSEDLSFTYFEKLKILFNVNNDKKLCEIIGINPRTLNRQKQENCFNKEESDQILKVWQIFNLAVQILGNKENAANWFQAPQLGLKNSLPIDLLNTHLESHEVEQLLYQIKYGIFS